MDRVDAFNSLPADDLLAVCAAPTWVERVAAGRPYASREEIVAAADTAARDLAWTDVLAALSAHPRIGERPPAGSQERREQAGAEGAGGDVLAAIAGGNRTYEERFGFTYVVRASGRSADEMLGLLRERLANDRETELRVAAAQQAEITALRLQRLLTGTAP